MAQNTISLDFDYVLLLDSSGTFPDQNLWIAIVARAMLDLKNYVRNRWQRKCDELIHHIRDPWFEIICENAGLNYKAISEFSEDIYKSLGSRK